ncbi:MAG: type VI secretion system tube protein Hcp [Verrucomicrobiales bacterium]
MRTTLLADQHRWTIDNFRVASLLILMAACATASPRVVFVVEDPGGEIIIGGESTDPVHPGWIDAIALGTGFEKLPSGGTAHAARRARLVVPDSFVITKHPDKASPSLQEALLLGEVLPVVRLKYLSGEPRSGSEPIVIELRQVLIEGYEISSGGERPLPGDTPPVELVYLSFEEIRWFYSYRDPATGEPREELSEWDVLYTTNAKDRDSDGDGLVNAIDLDDDNDGASDSDELAALLNPLVDDMHFDFDQDGDSNMGELLAGTDPNSGHSFFAIDSIGLRYDQGELVAAIRLPATGGRLYRVMGTLSPGDPDAWFLLAEFPVESGTPGGMEEFELPAGVVPLLPQLIFRVTVELPPPRLAPARPPL